MGPFLGVILHAIGGYAAASFYIPFKKVKQWAWESYWLISGIAAWLVTPWVMAYFTIPEVFHLLDSAPASSLFWSFVFGMLWGIGGLTFGLSMRYLGMSLGYAIALGCSAAFGTIIPPLVAGTFGELLAETSGIIILSGVLVCLFGISVCGWAGIQKEKEMPEQEKTSVIKEFNLKKGLGVAFASGILSACMAFALAAGKPIANLSITLGADPLWQNNGVLIVVLAGGFTTNFIWCIILNFRNKTFGDYGNKNLKLTRNYIFSSLAGIIWYMQFFFYGMGSSKMGAYDFASWTLHMAFIILFSNLWGLYFNEWKGSGPKTMRLIFTGLIIILISTLLIGWGTYIS